ncbi:MAG TPA: hypothetical protein VFP84_33895 [Kofleriaceae bacterium]|nr:hypothetical protein [Kofleriaceae bacterium]
MALGACGGGKKKVEQPKDDGAALKQPVPPPETEEDREKKRHAEALAIIPEGSTCLPPELRSPTAPRLELAAIGAEAVVCAVDQDRTRLLGAVGCWSVDVHSGELKYQPPAPLPGRGFAVQLDDHCARGFCLPKDAKVPTDPVAFMAWNLDNSKVAVLAGDNVHIFDAASKAHESTFSIRGDKGVTSDPTAINWAGDKNGGGEALFIEASDGTTSPVFAFKPDGTPIGPIEAIGSTAAKPNLLSTKNGSFMLLDTKRVAISEQGFSTVTTYEIDTGKRAKLVRKLPAGPCKKDELDASWRDPAAQVAPKCKDYITKTFSPLIGADAVAGSKNFLVLLRGPRLGELAGIDAKTLSEKKTIKMPWCDAAGGAAPAAGGDKP